LEGGRSQKEGGRGDPEARGTSAQGKKRALVNWVAVVIQPNEWKGGVLEGRKTPSGLMS